MYIIKEFLRYQVINELSGMVHTLGVSLVCITDCVLSKETMLYMVCRAHRGLPVGFLLLRYSV